VEGNPVVGVNRIGGDRFGSVVHDHDDYVMPLQEFGEFIELLLGLRQKCIGASARSSRLKRIRCGSFWIAEEPRWPDHEDGVRRLDLAATKVVNGHWVTTTL
jgi:hypothetical protein